MSVQTGPVLLNFIIFFQFLTVFQKIYKSQLCARRLTTSEYFSSGLYNSKTTFTIKMSPKTAEQWVHKLDPFCWFLSFFTIFWWFLHIVSAVFGRFVKLQFLLKAHDQTDNWTLEFWKLDQNCGFYLAKMFKILPKWHNFGARKLILLEP